jgi:hypothetical protein
MVVCDVSLFTITGDYWTDGPTRYRPGPGARARLRGQARARVRPGLLGTMEVQMACYVEPWYIVYAVYSIWYIVLYTKYIAYNIAQYTYYST